MTAPPQIPASGSDASLNVSAARDCTWTAASDAGWITVNPTSGQGDGSIAIKVGANAIGRSRSSAIAVNETRVTVNQEAAPCRFELSTPGMRVDFEGGHTSVNVSAIEGCDWRTSGADSWVRVLTQSGSGNGAVEFDVSPNDGGERSATLSIAGVTFVVVQNARTSGPGNLPPSPTTCSFSIDPDRATVRGNSGQGSFRVITDSGCSWRATTGTSWISVQRDSGSGPDTVTYQVSTNTSAANDRSGEIAVAGRTHRVTQQPCAVSIESSGSNLPYSAGSYDFRVTADGSCFWFANSNADWLILIRNGGTGSGAISYRVLENQTNRERTATITVAGQRKVIVQQPLGQG